MLPNRPQQERALAMDVKSMQCVMLADVADLLKIKKLKGRRNLDTSSQGLHTPPNYSKKNLTRKGMPLLTFPFNTNYNDHVRNFLDVMRLHAENDNLCLREFFKSLTDMAHPWYNIFTTKTYQTMVFSCGLQVYSS